MPFCVQGTEVGKKGDKKKELEELNELFKPVVAAQKVAKGELEASGLKVCMQYELIYRHIDRKSVV